MGVGGGGGTYLGPGKPWGRHLTLLAPDPGPQAGKCVQLLEKKEKKMCFPGAREWDGKPDFTSAPSHAVPYSQ